MPKPPWLCPKFRVVTYDTGFWKQQLERTFYFFKREKFVKLYLHSSYTVQISFCFDENPGKNISDEVLKLKMNAISTVVILGRKFKYFRDSNFFISKMKMIHF